MHPFLQFGRRRAAVAVFVLASLAGTGLPAAQERLDSSALAGVAFPEPSWSWSGDPDGTKQNTIETAADVLEHSCGPTEFHAWQITAPAAAEDLSQRTDAAFQQAGWSYRQTISADPAVAHLAEKGERALVLTWVHRPEQEALVLLLCEAQAAAPGQAPSQKLSADQPPTGRDRSAAVGEQAPIPAATEVRDNSDTDGGSVVLGAGAVFSLVGFVFAAGAIRTRRRAGAASKWPMAPAKVISSEVVEETGRDSDGHLETHYVPRIRYSYQVGGKDYEASRIRVTDLAFSWRKKAQEIVDRYPAGATVSVRYDPADPTNTVVETVKPSIFIAIFGSIFFVVGLVMALAGMAGA